MLSLSAAALLQALAIGGVEIPWSALGLFAGGIGGWYSLRYESRATRRAATEALDEAKKGREEIAALALTSGRLEERVTVQIETMQEEIRELRRASA